MLRSHGRACSLLPTRFLSAILGVGYLLLICTAQMFGIAPSVTFDGVVSALSTGSVSLSGPAGVAVDRAGNVFIADTGNNQIVKIDSSGNASVLAITGLSTALSSPSGVAVDDAGNLYIADKGNSRIVLASSSGAGSVVSTGAVTLSSPHGVALDASGNLFIADTGNSQIVEVAAGGVASVYSITGLGTALAGPKGLAEDVAGNLYIADSTNNRIVKVTSGGAGSVVDLSGLVTALSGPSGVAVDAAGNIYVADAGNNRVVSVAALAALATASLTLTSPKGVAAQHSYVPARPNAGIGWCALRLWREQPEDDADTEKLHGDSYSYIGNGGALDFGRSDSPVIRRGRSPYRGGWVQSTHWRNWGLAHPFRSILLARRNGDGWNVSFRIKRRGILWHRLL
jgi:sugar lactone lactonase YvrE